ncbi:MAG: ABC transporter ATP-binding protein, partial [Rhodospirillales bacterium]|nr:ABC transporter ATP-binding protein [Rhodospirillales bacterium]
GAHLILLDEVLAGLTPAEIEGAIAMVRAIRDRGTTILFIEHNMRAVLELTDRVVVLNHGQIIAEGTPRAVMREPAVVAAYLGTADA